MVVTVNPENANKKRKKDGIIDSENCGKEEPSPSKSLKLNDQLGGDMSTETSQDSESDEPESSQELSDDCSDKEELREEEGQCSMKNFVTEQPQPSISLAADHQIKDQRILELNEKLVFTELLKAFSQENLPDKITHKGKGYNLTAVYDEFWNEFYNSHDYSEGNKLKIPKIKNMNDLELKSLVKILKRGWEDERYWPRKLCYPFLECCLFEELSSNSIEQETFLKFIDSEDKKLIKDKETVDNEIFQIFKKYGSANKLIIGDKIEDSCKKLAYEIMITNMKPVIGIWKVELFDVMPRSTFDFLMGPLPTPPPIQTWNDMSGFEAPHELWGTFLLGWPEEKMNFYFKALNNEVLNRNKNYCHFCKEPYNAKHFISSCKKLLDPIRTKRHDAILDILLDKINLAIERKCCYFNKGSDWKVLTYHENVPYAWPEVMEALKNVFYKGQRKYPHIVVYSLSPEKRALIIEHSISWEHWMETQQEGKEDEYMLTREALEKLGFEVEYRIVVLGCRGVLVPDLYSVFEEICGMKHAEISKTLEEIARELISFPYESKYYKELME